MKKTRKALVAVLGVLCALCASMAVLAACGGEPAKLDSISITTPPTKVSYVAGEQFDPAGMVITAKYSDETEKTLTAEDWTCDTTGALTLSNGVFETKKSIKFSYTEKEETKTVSQQITIHNYITAATITTQPQTEYSLGQSFSVKGMVINATLEDNTTKSIEVTAENSKLDVTGALSRKTTQVTVTVGNFDVKVGITMLPVLYVEGETGYRNGALIDQSTGDSGNVREDSKAADAAQGVEALYKAELRAKFAVDQMKKAGTYDETEFAKPSDKTAINVGGKPVTKEYDAIVAWLADKANKTAIEEYEKSEAFTKAIEDYKKTDAYTALCEEYTAHAAPGEGENYLGQNNQGDVLSFVFESSAVSKGSVEFRFASAYLFKDNNWAPIIMGDMQFNKLVEIYVNGVKAEIPNDKILPGGMSADGSTVQQLWCHWQLVKLDNVDLVAGRNVIEVKFLNHGIVGSQSGYNFAANVDTLLVAVPNDSTAELDTYDNSTAIDYTVSGIDLTKTALTVKGTLGADSKGYIGDIFVAKAGDNVAEIAINGNNFTATFNIEDFELGEYPVTLSGSAIKNAKITGSPIKDGHITYTVTSSATATTFKIESDQKVELSEVTIGTDFKLEERNGKAYFVVSGTATYKTENYSEEEKKAAVEAALKAAIYFDLQNNPNEGSGSGWTTLIKNEHVITIKEEGKFELAVDLSKLKVSAATMHLAPESARTGNDGWNDYKPAVDQTAKGEAEVAYQTLKVGDFVYTIVYQVDRFFNCVGIRVAPGAQFTVTSVALTEIGGKASLEFEGTFKGYTEAEIKTLKIDCEGAAINELTLTWTVDASKSTFKATADISALPAADFYYMHAGFDAVSKQDGDKVTAANPNISASKANCVGGKTVLISGNKMYVLGEQYGTRGFKVINATDKAFAVADANLVVEGEGDSAKLMLVISGGYTGYTKAEFEALVVKFNFQGNPYVSTGKWDGDWAFKTFADKTVTANDNGTFEIKIDISAMGTKNFDYTSHMTIGAAADMDESKEAKDGGPADFKLSHSFTKTVTYKGVTFKLISVAGSGDGAQFWGCVGLNVSGVAAA